jgi:hypothetical protein
MEPLTLKEAARESGRSARELRLIIEAGDLPASRREGLWCVDRADLEALAPAASPQTGPRLVEAPASARPPTDASSVVHTPGNQPAAHPVDELLSRLEARAMEVAILREERAALDPRAPEKVERLERELAATRAQLEAARRLIVELQGPEPRAARRRHGMRDALIPLFEQTRTPGDPTGPAA